MARKGDTPLRFCTECTEAIPRTNEAGEIASNNNYERKNTCGKRACITSRRFKTAGINLPEVEQAELDIYDYFILGKQSILRAAA